MLPRLTRPWPLFLFSLPAHAIVYWYVLYHGLCHSPARIPPAFGRVYDATEFGLTVRVLRLLSAPTRCCACFRPLPGFV